MDTASQPDQDEATPTTPYRALVRAIRDLWTNEDYREERRMHLLSAAVLLFVLAALRAGWI